MGDPPDGLAGVVAPKDRRNFFFANIRFADRFFSAWCMYAPMDRDLVQFHIALLGSKQPFEITPLQKQLYAAYTKGERGHMLPSISKGEDFERFLAAFVAAFNMTSEGKVHLIIHQRVNPWAIEQIKLIASHIFSIRKGKSSREVIQRLYLQFQSVLIGPETRGPEPKRWVAYGFVQPDVAPNWMKMRLGAPIKKPKA